MESSGAQNTKQIPTIFIPQRNGGFPHEEFSNILLHTAQDLYDSVTKITEVAPYAKGPAPY